MVGREINDDLDAVCMRGRDEAIKVCPSFRGVAEMLFDAFEVAPLIAVISGGRVALIIGDVRVTIINGRRTPDGGDAETGQVRHLLSSAGQIAASIGDSP